MITFPCYNKIKEQYDLFLAVYRYDYAKLILLVRMGLGFESLNPRILLIVLVN